MDLPHIGHDHDGGSNLKINCRDIEGDIRDISGTPNILGFAVSSTLKLSADTERTTNAQFYNLIKQARVYLPGTIRVGVTIKLFDIGDDNSTGYFQLRVNASVISDISFQTTGYQSYEINTPVAPGDLIGVYMGGIDLSSPVYIKNFRLYYNLANITSYAITTLA